MIQVGDVGTLFTFTVVDENNEIVDLSTVMTKQFIFQKPDKTLLTVDATFGTNGSDGVLTYVTRQGDLDKSGTWKYQVYVSFGSEIKYSTVYKFKVLPNLPL